MHSDKKLEQYMTRISFLICIRRLVIVLIFNIIYLMYINYYIYYVIIYKYKCIYVKRIQFIFAIKILSSLFYGFEILKVL